MNGTCDSDVRSEDSIDMNFEYCRSNSVLFIIPYVQLRVLKNTSNKNRQHCFEGKSNRYVSICLVRSLLSALFVGDPFDFFMFSITPYTPFPLEFEYPKLDMNPSTSTLSSKFAKEFRVVLGFVTLVRAGTAAAGISF
jgi:hypothetical protein